MKTKTTLLLLCSIFFAVHVSAQETDGMSQINYENLPDPVKNSLGDEIDRMNLQDFRFNFYKVNLQEQFAITFLRQGADIKALEGLETIIFFKDGSVVEKRYKYYAEEILASAPLDLIMSMQEKTKNIELDYLSKYAPSGLPVSYCAISKDSVYIFDEGMVFQESVKRKTDTDKITYD
ncbi:hypothetical protein N7E81_12320 [Reichenbachiella carrageenanivorans]|uniref:Beta-lactamase-inhibitor-like, PepSY-like n=1 Tax=Reichenbachiella carrageenanivorans TaxID=2979869 RepID=A0ABY6CWQ5_9BACT|nr:hypothetical protein [Reichenbachiella carrageenanivorans]UXX78144.1 hypothetical protein N7E81_12320 [Reichenbachiella carrageenanivorans]